LQILGEEIMSSGVRPAYVCKWRTETLPDHEVHIRKTEDGKKLKVYLIRPSSLDLGLIDVDIKELPITATFERCVWKSNDYPEMRPLESRFFRSRASKSATWVGIDVNDGRLHVSTLTNFDDDKLKQNALVYDPQHTQLTFQPLPQPCHEAYDSQAEKGMIRPTKTGEQEVVHIWDHVGQDGVGDLRLVRRKEPDSRGAMRDELMLELFYRATGNTSIIQLSNTSAALTNAAVPIETRIVTYAQHPVAILGERSGNAYGKVELSSSADAQSGLKNFFDKKNLQATPTVEIAKYIQDTLFRLKDEQGKVVSEVYYRTRVEVSRESNYDFGPEHGGKQDVIRIHLSKHFLRKACLPFSTIVAFFSGIFNSEAPRIHQLKYLDERGMQDLLQENEGVALDNQQKKRIFEDFDLAVDGGACIDFYIAVNRKTAQFLVGGFCYRICSGAVSLGRALSLRPLWETPPEQGQNQPMSASGRLHPIAAGQGYERV
jgi:hypothetical protein